MYMLVCVTRKIENVASRNTKWNGGIDDLPPSRRTHTGNSFFLRARTHTKLAWHGMAAVGISILIFNKRVR
jgi:hypothetical protein